MNIAAIKVAVEDWNEDTVEVPLFQLIQWKHAMRLEAKGGKFRNSVTAHVRKVLSTPRRHPRAELIAYLTAVIDDTHAQLEELKNEQGKGGA